jgi:hypothetical protein
MARKILAASVGLAAVFVFGVGIGSAGLLDWGVPFPDGPGLWRGTTAFSSEDEPLAGTVDWVVYGPGNFPFSGYEPTEGEYTYVYQVHNSPDPAGVDITTFTVDVQNEADRIAWFTDLAKGVSGTPATEMQLDWSPDVAQAYWRFGEHGNPLTSIGIGGSSAGLVFSSPKQPMASYAGVVDGGLGVIVVPVPTPSANPIPEPATVSLAMAGLVVLAALRLRGTKRIAR